MMKTPLITRPLMLSAAAAAVSLALLVGACAQSEGAQPDDMSVEAHRHEAQKHERLSAEHAAEYDPQATASRERTVGNPSEQIYATETYNPTAHHRTTAKRHAEHAEQHRHAAQALVQFEEAHCAKFPEQTRAQCPLMGQVTAVEDIAGGARLTLAAGVPLQAMVDHMECHFAFARTEGYQGMQSCPLYLEAVSVEAEPATHSVRLTTTEADAVQPLRERSRAHLEQ